MIIQQTQYLQNKQPIYGVEELGHGSLFFSPSLPVSLVLELRLEVNPCEKTLLAWTAELIR